MTLKLKDKTTPKGPKTGITWLALVVDRSGSMSPIAKDMEGGIATLFKDQAEMEGTCLVTVTQFDDKYEVLGTNVPVEKIDSYTLTPRGSTALFDAIGKTVATLKDRVATTTISAQPKTVIVSIITDGYENASKEWKQAAIKDLIEAQKAKGWIFTFLGANQDAILTAEGLGIAAGQTMTYTGDSEHTINAMHSHTSNLRSARASGMAASYGSADRQDAVNDEDAKRYPSNR